MLRRAMVATLLSAASIAAHAAPITRSYQVAATNFSSGPVAALTQKFTLTFDPSVSVSSDSPVTGYFESSGLAAFAGPVSFITYSQNLSTYGTAVVVGGTLNGAGRIVNGTDDFFTQFYVDAYGNPFVYGPSFRPSVTYEMAGSSTVIQSNTVTVTALTTPVPEPATWAMMIAGFGLVGGTMRRRRVSVAFA